MKQPKREQIPVPRLNEDVKAMNGRSTKRLSQCIDALSDLLDDEEVRHEQVVKEPNTLRDPGTE